MPGGRGAGMELRRHVPRDEEREPEVLATFLDPGAAPPHLFAVRTGPGTGLHGEPQPRGGGLDVDVGETGREPPITGGRELEQGPAEHGLGSDLFVDDRQQLDVVAPERRDHVGRPPSRMTPTRDEAEPVIVPETLGGAVEITDGEHDVVDPRHRPRPLER